MKGNMCMCIYLNEYLHIVLMVALGTSRSVAL